MSNQEMEKVELPGSVPQREEDLVSPSGTDLDSESFYDSNSDSDSDIDASDTTVDPEQLDQENPFVPPPPYEANAGSGATPPQTQHNSRLGKPIAIPATSHKLGSPFLRAYPPCLEGYNLSSEEFLKFTDELNRATIKSPPFRILGLAGKIVGYMPLGIGINEIVGAGVEVAAGVGAAAVSKGRTELLMREANRDIFGPRGLKCEIANLNAVAKIANIPILDDKGKISKSAPVLSKVEPGDYKKYKNENGKVMIMQRRLDAFDGYVAPLTLADLPELATSNNAMGRWNARASEKERRKGEKRMMKQALKADRKSNPEEKLASRYDRKIAKEQRKLDEAIELEGADSKLAQKEQRKLEKKRDKMDSKYDERLRKVEKKAGKESKVEKCVKKGLWIIIREVDVERK